MEVDQNKIVLLQPLYNKVNSLRHSIGPERADALQVKFDDVTGYFTEATLSSSPSNTIKFANAAVEATKVVLDNPPITEEIQQIINEISILSESILLVANSLITSDTLTKGLQEALAEQSVRNKHLTKLIEGSHERIEAISLAIPNLEENLKQELLRTNKLYDDSLIRIQQKEDEINVVLGRTASGAIAADHEKSAIQEKQMADAMRVGSLFCMAVAVLITGSSIIYNFFWTFDPMKSALAFLAGFIMSIPAAYLAKESSKHREQQYNYHQTSLDLKALSPYIATLPEEEQHKIKIDIANKIFGSRDSIKTTDNSYPVDTQAVIMALLSKIGSQKN